MKRNKKIIQFVFSSQSTILHRVKYFEKDFLFFCLYYFPEEFSHPLADFQKNYCNDLQKWFDLFFVGFRECGKTMFLRYYYVWCILYKKRHFIMHYNSDENKGKKMLFDITVILQKNERIIRDFWYLYMPPEGRKKSDPTKKTIGEFITSNQIMMKAMSIGKSPRWETFYIDWEWTFRPDLVCFDDIDTIKNVKNPDIIADDVYFIQNEVFGGVDAFCQKIFLWNVVSDDGRVPRLKKYFEGQKSLVSSLKIYWIRIREKWKIVWSRFVASDREASLLNKTRSEKSQFISLENKRALQGTIAYNENFNLIAYKKWQQIISSTMIQYYMNLPHTKKIVIGIDPAFSEKTGSDPIGITVTAHEKFEKETYKYIIEMTQLEGKNKNEDAFCAFIENLTKKYSYSVIYVENNNGGWILARMLKKRRLSVNIINSEKDKVTRLKEYQWEIERGIIKFNPDEKYVWEWIEQLKNFPNANHDDMVDSMVFSFYPALEMWPRLL